MRFYQNLCVGAGCLLMAGAVMAQGSDMTVSVQPDAIQIQVPSNPDIETPVEKIQFEQVNNTSNVRGEQPRTPYSILICRSKQCAKAEYSMTREFLYNRLVKLFESNLNKDVLLCEADPVSRVCYNHGIRVPAQTSMFNVDIKIPSARVLDAKLLKGETALDLIFDYSVDINNMRAVCQSSVTRLSVDFIDKVQMLSPGFDCRFTTTGNSALNASYNIDYVDFDYGTIGAYYTIGVGESVRGGATGYTLMRFVEPSVAVEEEIVVESVDAEQK